MKNAAAKIVLKLENFEEKQLRVDITQELLTTLNDVTDLLKKVVTGDETTSQHLKYFCIFYISHKT